jgi:hypothetical protein
VPNKYHPGELRVGDLCLISCSGVLTTAKVTHAKDHWYDVVPVEGPYTGRCFSLHEYYIIRKNTANREDVIRLLKLRIRQHKFREGIQ